jgi:exodeoxyribonuclease V alpha subunit
VEGATGFFKYNRHNPLAYDLVVADEFSMADINLAHSLFSAVGHNRAILLAGDVDQLPSVGPGRVLHDLISSGAVPVAMLSTVHRQKGGSMIITAAHAINRGEMPPPGPEDIPKSRQDYIFLKKPNARATRQAILKMVHENLYNHPLLQGEYDPIRDVMVVCAMKKGEAGSHMMNISLRNLLNPLPKEGDPDRMDVYSAMNDEKRSFGVGDKIMNTVNKVEQYGIVNGDIGYIKSFDHKNNKITVEFERSFVELDRSDFADIELAYAITVHKSQGSESRVLIMPVVSDYSIMLQRNLVYTGLTRAKTLAIGVGQEFALRKAIVNTDNHMRWSYTGEALQSCMREMEEDELIPD